MLANSAIVFAIVGQDSEEYAGNLRAHIYTTLRHMVEEPNCYPRGWFASRQAFLNIIEGLLLEGTVTFDEYIKKRLRPRDWASLYDALIAASLLQRTIVVVVPRVAIGQAREAISFFNMRYGHRLEIFFPDGQHLDMPHDFPDDQLRNFTARMADQQRQVVDPIIIWYNSTDHFQTILLAVSRELGAVLLKYGEVFNDGLGRCTRQISLKFKPEVQSKKCKPRPVPFALRSEVEKVIDKWVKDGVLEQVTTSDWATPLVIVPKPGNKIRLCCDYKVTVNPWLDIHQYPLPRPEELFSVLNGGEKFSKLELKEAYLQLMLDDKAKECLTICTHKGLYQFTRMPYGVASAPAIFQQVMEDVLRGIDGVAVYLDDIVVTAPDDAEHLKRLEMTLQRIQKFGLRVKKEKCSFMQNQIAYFGHIIDKHGIRTSPEKVEAIQKMPAPKI
ncbi:hypothetical protein niasHT_021998 [Heterodera trifolii]|uniref:Reverse transcriptase domain-containing protein n=1 Tax=Heterodera trifolii TaxID=157864 RepID=A0ABD2JNE8_9BILA